jgi:hypothetical protein
MEAMNYARHHPRLAVLGIGVAFALAAPMWVGTHGDGTSRLMFVLALEAIPFLALAAAADELPWWLAVAAAGAFGAFTDIGVRDITESTSSTAVIAIPFIPLLLLLAVPCLVAVCDIAALARMAIGGARFAPPRRGEIALALVLGTLGLMASFVPGLVAGLAVAFAVWAHRVRPHPLYPV